MYTTLSQKENAPIIVRITQSKNKPIVLIFGMPNYEET